MVAIQQGLREDGFEVSMVKLRRWFGVARRTVSYRPTKTPPTVRPDLAQPIKASIEAAPSFGYRTVAGLLGMNKNTVQRIFQLKGWEVRKRAVGRDRGSRRCHRWRRRRMSVGRPTYADLGRSRRLADDGLSDRLPHTSIAGLATLSQWPCDRRSRGLGASPLITRYGTLGRVPEPFLLRSDNGPMFASRH